jgi:UDPglucose 6-dehydrogenase
LDRVASLYKAIRTTVHKVDTRTAETIKYASNAFLATKISFINEMAAVCEALGADVVEVAKGMGMDSRIGSQFLSAGLGWGGSCFPKDVKALAHMAAVHGTHPQLLRSVMDINSNQRLRAVQKLRKALGTLDGRYVLVLGAAFKGGTDDIRQSPSIDVARLLMLEGARVVIHDPVVTAEALATELPGPQLVNDVLKGARGVDAIVLATDWADYRDLPLKTMRELALGSTLLDTRNFLDPDSVRAAGFDYLCLGRPNVEGRGAERTDARPAPDLAPVAGL